MINTVSPTYALLDIPATSKAGKSVLIPSGSRCGWNSVGIYYRVTYALRANVEVVGPFGTTRTESRVVDSYATPAMYTFKELRELISS